MSDLNLWDHAFALSVFLIYPVYAKLTFGEVLEDIRNRGERGRLGTYKITIFTWLVFAFCVVAMWILFDREWAALGVCSTSQIQFAVGLVVAVLVIAMFVVPLRNLVQTPERIEEFEDGLGDLGLMLPLSRTEEAWFKGVSLNAGVTEELIARGYLIWYAGHFLEPFWSAAIAAVWFGLAHMYQGLKQLPGILLVSIVAVSLFVYTGSLLVPILFHVFLDAIQGHYIAKIRRSNAPKNTLIPARNQEN